MILPTHEIDVRASIDEFAVDPFNPLFNGVLDEFSGTLQGGLEWYGPLEAYTLNGAFTMSDGHFSAYCWSGAKCR